MCPRIRTPAALCTRTTLAGPRAKHSVLLSHTAPARGRHPRAPRPQRRPPHAPALPLQLPPAPCSVKSRHACPARLLGDYAGCIRQCTTQAPATKWRHADVCWRTHHTRVGTRAFRAHSTEHLPYAQHSELTSKRHLLLRFPHRSASGVSAAHRCASAVSSLKPLDPSQVHLRSSARRTAAPVRPARAPCACGAPRTRTPGGARARASPARPPASASPPPLARAPPPAPAR